MADQDWDNFNWDLFKQDQLEFDQSMERAAFENTYLILTGKATYESLLEKESMQSGSIDQHIQTAILFNPLSKDYSPKFPHLHNEVERKELIDSMIDYYVDTEEYEKCAKLVKIKKD
jgi:hypothetical protein